MTTPNNTNPHVYTTREKVIFWSLWVVGLIALIIMGYLVIIGIALGAWPITLTLVPGILVIIGALGWSLKKFINKEPDVSNIIAKLAIAVIVVPLVSGLGCMVFLN